MCTMLSKYCLPLMNIFIHLISLLLGFPGGAKSLLLCVECIWISLKETFFFP